MVVASTRYHTLFVAMVGFLCIVAIIVVTKPDWLFNDQDELHQYGVGYGPAASIPTWLAAAMLAGICYAAAAYLNKV